MKRICINGESSKTMANQKKNGDGMSAWRPPVNIVDMN